MHIDTGGPCLVIVVVEMTQAGAAGVLRAHAPVPGSSSGSSTR